MTKNQPLTEKDLQPYEADFMETIVALDKQDMDEWEYEDYVNAAHVVIEAKIYTQWVLGKITYKVAHYYPQSIEQFAKDVKLSPSSLRTYSSVYQTFIKANPDFSPERYYGAMPWGVIAYVAKASRKNGSNPVQVLDDLADKGVSSIKHAHKEVKEEETGNKAPNKPKAQFKYKETSKKWDLVLMADNLTEDIDWNRFVQKYYGFMKEYILENDM